MKDLSEVQILRSRCIQLEGIICALNSCIDDPERHNLCTELTDVAAKLSTQVGRAVDELLTRNPGAA